MSIKFASKHTITVGFTDTVSYGYSSKTIRTEDTIDVELSEDSKLVDAYASLKKIVLGIHQSEVAKAFDELKKEVNDRKAQELKEKEEEALRIQKEKEANKLPETKDEAKRVVISVDNQEMSIENFVNNSTFKKIEDTLTATKDSNPRVYRALLIMLDRYDGNKVTESQPVKTTSSTNDPDVEFKKAYNYPTPEFCQMKGKKKDVRILGNCTTRELEWIAKANKSTEIERKYAGILLSASKQK